MSRTKNPVVQSMEVANMSLRISQTGFKGKGTKKGQSKAGASLTNVAIKKPQTALGTLKPPTIE